MSGKPQVDFSLYLITDRNQVPGGDLCAAIESALRGGVRAVQLREKDLAGRELYELACRLRQITSRYGAKLLINERLDIALAAGADGVHLGESSIPLSQARRIAGKDMLLGVSCHDREKALAAQDNGADFITFSPIFYTPSKAVYGDPVGTERLAEVCRLLRIPVFALGGIKRETVRTVLGHGAHGIALISAILASDDPERAAREMLAEIHRQQNQKGTRR
jgi:thiamine-phosphate pyrophosphorylase